MPIAYELASNTHYGLGVVTQLMFLVSVTLLLFNSTQKYMGIQVLPIHKSYSILYDLH